MSVKNVVRIIVAITVGLPGLLAAATGLEQVLPDEQGMSADRLARIGPAMQAYIDRREVAGTVTLVARNGTIVYQDARGYADLAAKRPLAVDSLFRMASQTKPVTAVAAMILL